MGSLHSTVTIIENQVVFSKEILEYFESLRNEETNEWVDKYIKFLSDTSNFDAPKYNIHHIKPCWLFKDKINNTRNKQQKLADAIDGNLIKLSIKNHIKAHYYLFRIYNDRSSKCSLSCLCQYIPKLTNMTEDEINEIAEMIEFYKSTNQTEEERQAYIEEHREDARIRAKNWTKNNKERSSAYHKNYKKINKEACKERDKKYREKNKERFKAKDDRPCFDPRYNKIFPRNGYKYKKFARWIDLFNWARHNKKHELRKGLTNTEFANKYLLNKEQLNEFKFEIENCIISNKVNASENECIDPRCGMKSKRGIYGKYTTFKSLQSWATAHKNHPLVNGMLPTPWAKQFLIKEVSPKLLTNENTKISDDPSVLCKDPRYGMIINNIKYVKEIVNYKTLVTWAKKHKSHSLVNNMKPSAWAKQFLINKPQPKAKIEIKKEIKIYESLENINKPCEDPRCGMIIGKRFYNRKYVSYQTLIDWAKTHNNHPLVNDMKPTDWAKQFLINKPKIRTSKSKNRKMCKDPRYGMKIGNKLYDVEIIPYVTLYSWATDNKNNPLLNGMEVAEWVNQFLIKQEKPIKISKRQSICKDPRKENNYISYSSLRMWAYENPNDPLVKGMNSSKWATQFILTPQELEEYKKTHSVE